MYLVKLFRSIIYIIAYILLYIVMSILLLIPIILNSGKMVDRIAFIWNKLTIFFLKIICGINYRVEGLENLPKNNENYVIVSKHQSAWETYFFLFFFKSINNRSCAFVLKKELLKIPFFGWSLKVSKNIAIDRAMGISSLKKAIKEAKYIVLEEKRNLVIFPQGTRTPPNATIEQYPYKVGFLAIIKELKKPLIPIALNTGTFWSKGQFVKNPGEVVIKILPPIKPEELISKDKNTVMQNISHLIEMESKKLY